MLVKYFTFGGRREVSLSFPPGSLMKMIELLTFFEQFLLPIIVASSDMLAHLTPRTTLHQRDIVSGLTFRSLIHFEFIFVCGVRK